MKKLTLLVPAYNGLIWLEKNSEFWTNVSKYAHVILVEDSKEEQMKNFCILNNIEYFSKPNGNWGSVINFAVKNKIIQTEWMAILDVDDTIKIEELKKLMDFLDDDYEVIFTDSDYMDFPTNSLTKRHSDKWVHSTWMKTEYFYLIDSLPENVFYTDRFFMAFAENAKKFKIVSSLSPYNYFVNIPGQSIEQKNIDMLLSKMPSYRVLEEQFRFWVDKNNLQCTQKEINSAEFVIANIIRSIYDMSHSKKELKKLEEVYSQHYHNKHIPISHKLLWSKIYRFFTLKWVQTR